MVYTPEDGTEAIRYGPSRRPSDSTKWTSSPTQKVLVWNIFVGIRSQVARDEFTYPEGLDKWPLSVVNELELRALLSKRPLLATSLYWTGVLQVGLGILFVAHVVVYWIMMLVEKEKVQ